MSDRSARPRLAFGLMAAERSLRRWIDRRAGSGSVSASGAGVLFYLATNGEAPIKDIAAALTASAPAMTGLLHRLEAAGLIARSAHPSDSRAILIQLTDDGREKLVDLREILAELNQHLFQGFSDTELHTVHRWLEHVRTMNAVTK